MSISIEDREQVRVDAGSRPAGRSWPCWAVLKFGSKRGKEGLAWRSRDEVDADQGTTKGDGGDKRYAGRVDNRMSEHME